MIYDMYIMFCFVLDMTMILLPPSRFENMFANSGGKIKIPSTDKILINGHETWNRYGKLFLRCIFRKWKALYCRSLVIYVPVQINPL